MSALYLVLHENLGSTDPAEPYEELYHTREQALAECRERAVAGLDEAIWDDRVVSELGDRTVVSLLGGDVTLTIVPVTVAPRPDDVPAFLKKQAE